MPDLQGAVSRRFQLHRQVDVTGVSGVGLVADGVLWPDGTASIRWRGERPSIVHWQNGMTDVDAIHGHGGHTQIVWLDREPASPPGEATDGIRPDAPPSPPPGAGGG